MPIVYSDTRSQNKDLPYCQSETMKADLKATRRRVAKLRVSAGKFHSRNAKRHIKKIDLQYYHFATLRFSLVLTVIEIELI